MQLFFLLAAALVVIVLAMLLPALVRKTRGDDPDRDQINVAIVQQQLKEIEARAAAGDIAEREWLDERVRLERDLADALEGQNQQKQGGSWMVWPVAALLPVLAGSMYLAIGTPRAFDAASYSAPTVVQNAPEAEQPPAPNWTDIIERIQARLTQQPDDAQAWFMLGRAYMNTGKFAEAEQAMRRSLEIDDTAVPVMVRLADAMTMTRQGDMRGEPTQVLQKALQIEPENPQALWLYGMAQRDSGDLSGAIESWQKLEPLLASDPTSQNEIRRLLAQVEEAAAGQTSSMQNPAAQSRESQAGTGAAEARTLTVNVALSDQLQAAGDKIVFVYARAETGPPMPLAVVRKKANELPFSVTLSNADAMVAGMNLNSFQRLVVGARVSQTGEAIAQPGDLMDEISGVELASDAEVELTISTTVPK